MDGPRRRRTCWVHQGFVDLQSQDWKSLHSPSSSASVPSWKNGPAQPATLNISLCIRGVMGQGSPAFRSPSVWWRAPSWLSADRVTGFLLTIRPGAARSLVAKTWFVRIAGLLYIAPYCDRHNAASVRGRIRSALGPPGSRVPDSRLVSGR